MGWALFDLVALICAGGVGVFCLFVVFVKAKKKRKINGKNETKNKKKKEIQNEIKEEGEDVTVDVVATA